MRRGCSEWPKLISFYDKSKWFRKPTSQKNIPYFGSQNGSESSERIMIFAYSALSKFNFIGKRKSETNFRTRVHNSIIRYQNRRVTTLFPAFLCLVFQLTVGQKNQECRLKYWANRSSVRSFTYTAHSFAYSAHSLARGKVNDWIATTVPCNNPLSRLSLPGLPVLVNLW